MAEIPDTAGIDPSSRFDPVPKDKYPVEITWSDNKPAKTGTGKYLELELLIINGQYAGRKLWDRLNLENDNAQTVEIAQRQLAQICHAVGKVGVRDSEQLHHIAMLAHVRYVPEGPDKHGIFRDAKNEISGYSPINAQQQASRPTAPMHPQQQSQQQAPPWRRARA